MKTIVSILIVGSLLISCQVTLRFQPCPTEPIYRTDDFIEVQNGDTTMDVVVLSSRLNGEFYVWKDPCTIVYKVARVPKSTGRLVKYNSDGSHEHLHTYYDRSWEFDVFEEEINKLLLRF